MEELDFEVDSLDSIPDNVRPLYKEHGGKFRLAVRGIDPADELKNALQRERDERKSAKARASELESELESIRTQSMEKNREFESLWKSEKAKATDWQTKFETLQKQTADKERMSVALGIARGITKDPVREELLIEKIMSATAYVDGQVQFSGEVGSTAEQVQKYFVTKYPFLADGLQSSGGGATGGTSAKAGEKFSDFTPEQLAQIRRENPTRYEQLRQTR